MQNFLEPIIREVGQAISKEVSKVSKRSLPDIISTSVMIILTLIATVSGVVTAYMYLSEHLLDRHAMLLVTLIVLSLAVISGLVTKNIMSKANPEENGPDKQSNKDDNPQSEMAMTLGLEAAKIIGQHPKNSAIIAMVVGVSMGVSPELRKAVFDHILPKDNR